ncbi:MAG: GNAT family N-acetyltransferase [Planctomycetaceae bacterium]|nr:GNAT family N-acetyltransferase [Planctomycetaceae bacterium]
MTDSVQLAAMTLADYQPVMDLWSACEGVRASESREELARILDRNPGLCLVARAGGSGGNAALAGPSLAGAILCCHDGRRGYLYHLGVAPGFRRQGIATQLVDRCLAELARLGIRRCTIFLIRGNADGEAFWRQHGWRERTDLVAFAKDLEQ